MMTVKCRGCLLAGQTAHMIPLSTETRHLFTQCTSISPPENDGPQHLCYHCYNQLLLWKSFKVLCQQRDEFIRKMADLDKLVVKEEPTEEKDQANSMEIFWDDQKGDSIRTSFLEDLEDIDVELNEELLRFEEDSGMVEEPLELVDIDGPRSASYDADDEDQDPVKDSRTALREIHEFKRKKVNPLEDGFWRCPICSACFSEFPYLRKHLKEHHIDKEDPRCPICSRSFSRSPKVISHLVSSHGDFWEPLNEEISSTNVSQSRPKCCPLCPEDFSDDFTLFCHVEEKHVTSTDLQCAICGQKFLNIEDLANHLIVDHSDGLMDEKEVTLQFRAFNISPFFECHLCEEFFENHEEYEAHVHEDHVENVTISMAGLWGETPVSSDQDEPESLPLIKRKRRNSFDLTQLCAICGKRVPHIEEHMRNIHNTEEKSDQICPQDWPMYKLPCKLSRCRFCGRNFSSSSQLEEHVKEQHCSPIEAKSKHVFLKYSYNK